MKEILLKHDKSIALVFFVLTLVFIVTAMTNEPFLNWVFERHQNQMSWFIRPVFLIPFCFLLTNEVGQEFQQLFFVFLQACFGSANPKR